MSDFAERLTDGYVRLHLPPGGSVGLDVAILDIAQDFLLTHLHDTPRDCSAQRCSHCEEGQTAPYGACWTFTMLHVGGDCRAFW